jgi:hypothetical protein
MVLAVRNIVAVDAPVDADARCCQEHVIKGKNLEKSVLIQKMV